MIVLYSQCQDVELSFHQTKKEKQKFHIFQYAKSCFVVCFKKDMVFLFGIIITHLKVH